VFVHLQQAGWGLCEPERKKIRHIAHVFVQYISRNKLGSLKTYTVGLGIFRHFAHVFVQLEVVLNKEELQHLVDSI
jgi:hypothetical protein